MNSHTLFHTVWYGVGLLGGAALFIGPFTARGRVAPQWMRLALWISGPIAVAWSLLEFTLLFGHQFISQHEYYLISHAKTLLARIGVGILLLLFASGKFITAFSRPKASPKPR